MTKRILYIVGIMSILGLKSSAQFTIVQNSSNMACAKSYVNPLFEPDLSDPTIIKASDGWFYAYGTENTWKEGEHHVTPIIKSKDLVKWSFVADAFAVKPSWKDGGGIWAPCVVVKDQRYYLYYSFSKWGDSNPGIGLAIADKPYGPFQDQGKIFDSNSIGVKNSIDPFYIEVGEGRLKKQYLFWGSFYGIYGIEIAEDMKTLVGEKFKIAGDTFEAVYIYQKDSKFYLFGSNGSCCEGLDSKYRVSVAVSQNIKGPYLTQAGKAILNNGQEGTPFLYGDYSAGWVGPGHNAEIITDDEGSTFFLYHAIDVKNGLLPNGATRRPLLMDEIHWDAADGWPYIKNNVPSGTVSKAPVFH